MKTNQNYNSLKEMVTSKDPQSMYLAATILRGTSHCLNKRSAKSLLSKIDLVSRIKDYQDICEEGGFEELTLEHFSFLPEDQRKRQFALHRINNISTILNGEWIADFNNGDQKKYYPWFKKTTSGWVLNVGISFTRAVSNRPGGCYFETEEKCKFAVSTFMDVWIDYLD